MGAGFLHVICEHPQRRLKGVDFLALPLPLAKIARMFQSSVATSIYLFV
jgi:hypothetical protein